MMLLTSRMKILPPLCAHAKVELLVQLRAVEPAASLAVSDSGEED